MRRPWEYNEGLQATSNYTQLIKHTILMKIIQHEQQKGLRPVVLNGRFEALMDLIQGKPNKFKEEEEFKK